MIPHDSENALDTHICSNCGFEHTHKFQWSWGKFWVGKFKNKFIAFSVYMVLQFICLLTKFVPSEIKWIIVIVSAIVTIIFMLGMSIDRAVEKMEIKAQLTAGANFNKEKKITKEK